MNTIKTLIAFTLALFGYSQSFAHYMWIETAETGKLGEKHYIDVFFGEYTYGVTEDPEGGNFKKVSNFDLWVVAPSGKKIAIPTVAKDVSFQGVFTPEEQGTYTVVLNNDDVDVIDYTKYDFGIFKTHYHATAKVAVGDGISATHAANKNGLAVVNVSGETLSKGSEVSLRILYKGEPDAGQKVTIFAAEGWSKELKTDERGMVAFSLPWQTQYTIETTRKEEVPGTFKGKEYEFIWHCATYCIKL